MVKYAATETRDMTSICGTGELGYDGHNGTRKIGPSYANPSYSGPSYPSSPVYLKHCHIQNFEENLKCF